MRRTGFWLWLVILLGLSAMAIGCGDDDDDDTGEQDDDDDDAGDDDSEPPDENPPSFDGVTDALQEENSVCLIWTPAVDDVDSQQDLCYNVYLSETSGGQDFSEATVTSAAGAGEACVTGLYYAGYRFFVVRAVDTSGNEDDNTVEVKASPRPARFTLQDAGGSGLEPTDPAGTIQENIDDIGPHCNGVVFVATGTYPENVVLREGIELRGGYAPDFTQRDSLAYPSIVEGSGEVDASIIRAVNGTIIDGFTIRGAVGSGSGVDAVNASPVISGNVITDNNRSGIYFGAIPEEAGGSGEASNPVIEGNLITGNGNLPCQYQEKYRNGLHYIRYYFEPCGGIYGYNLRGATIAEIRNNIIADNTGHGVSIDVGYTRTAEVNLGGNWIEDNAGHGVKAQVRGFNTYYGDNPGVLGGMIEGNQIRNNRDGIHHAGEQRSEFQPVIARNRILANRGHGIYGSVTGFIGEINIFGHWVHYHLPSVYEGTIRNNIIAQNALDGVLLSADGFDWYPYSTHPHPSSGTIGTEIINNDVVVNAGSGIRRHVDVGGSGSPVVMNSVLVDNGDDLTGVAATYSDVSDGDSGTGNLAVIPQFLHVPGLVDFTLAVGAQDCLVVADSVLYTVGQTIEISGDGQPREVISTPSTTEVEFSPGLGYPTEADMAVALWGWETDVDEDYSLAPASPLIDAGNPDPAYDDQQPPGQGDPRNDMGAYGGPHAGTVGPDQAE